MFVNTDNGRMIPISRITSISPERDRRVKVYIEDGSSFEALSACVMADIVANMPLVPSLPEFYVIGVPTNADDIRLENLWKIPILAWRANEFGYLIPVTLESITDDYAILLPNGGVISPEDRWWHDVNSYVEDMYKDAKKRAAK